MNGPQHYAEAERLLQDVDALIEWPGNGTRSMAAPTWAPTLLAAAQVHATLALAAAGIDVQYGYGQQRRAWLEALDYPESSPPSAPPRDPGIKARY